MVNLKTFDYLWAGAMIGLSTLAVGIYQHKANEANIQQAESAIVCPAEQPKKPKQTLNQVLDSLLAKHSGDDYPAESLLQEKPLEEWISTLPDSKIPYDATKGILNFTPSADPAQRFNQDWQLLGACLYGEGRNTSTRWMYLMGWTIINRMHEQAYFGRNKTGNPDISDHSLFAVILNPDQYQTFDAVHKKTAIRYQTNFNDAIDPFESIDTKKPETWNPVQRKIISERIKASLVAYDLLKRYETKQAKPDYDWKDLTNGCDHFENEKKAPAHWHHKMIEEKLGKKRIGVYDMVKR